MQIPEVNIRPCLAYDAICVTNHPGIPWALGLRGLILRLFANKIFKLINEIEKCLSGTLKKDRMQHSFSTLCLILSAYVGEDDPTTLSVGSVADIFADAKNLRRVVAPRITNEFIRSHIIPTLDNLVDNAGNSYIVHRLRALASMGFETIWQERVLPELHKTTNQAMKYLHNQDVSHIFADITRMKYCEPIRQIDIIVSYFSYPVCFALHGTGFLINTYAANQIKSMIYHELMHGFANDELVQAYIAYVQADPWMKKRHRQLLTYSGNEEEFVAAAECYLRLVHSDESYEDLLFDLARRNNHSTAAVLFDLLSQEVEPPTDYNAWLLAQFNSGKLPGGRTRDFIESISRKTSILRRIFN